MHKIDGTQTYHLAKEMIPVYAIAITQERYFEDDRTRKLDGYYAHLKYVAEEKLLARMEGIKKGIEKGRTEGRAEGPITTIIGLIKDGILTIESGAKRLNISESELTAYLS